ncbi:MAG: 4Fe-4S dicluster domain-containing protein [Proteobacteria bacterium]|nr:4Fe-4S dicluster domain-containing protein [Pseudomonadota bacterium]
MLINVDKCTGCGACMVACASENNVNVLPDESDKVRSITWMRVYRIDNGRKFPQHQVAYFPRPCMHCEGARDHDFFGRPVRPAHADALHHDKHGSPDTPCISVCPPTATDYDPQGGIVSQITTRCIGCRYCVAACPYHARYFNWFDGDWPSGMERYLNPKVAPRMRGVVEKCTFCHHRLMAARAKATYQAKIEAAKKKKTGPVHVKMPRYRTACAEACPAGAINFGIISDPRDSVAELIKVGRQKGYGFRLLENLKTNPKVHYFSERKWVRQMADNSLKWPFAAQLFKT